MQGGSRCSEDQDTKRIKVQQGSRCNDDQDAMRIKMQRDQDATRVKMQRESRCNWDIQCPLHFDLADLILELAFLLLLLLPFVCYQNLPFVLIKQTEEGKSPGWRKEEHGKVVPALLV